MPSHVLGSFFSIFFAIRLDTSRGFKRLCFVFCHKYSNYCVKIQKTRKKIYFLQKNKCLPAVDVCCWLALLSLDWNKGDYFLAFFTGRIVLSLCSYGFLKCYFSIDKNYHSVFFILCHIARISLTFFVVNMYFFVAIVAVIATNGRKMTFFYYVFDFLKNVAIFVVEHIVIDLRKGGKDHDSKP